MQFIIVGGCFPIAADRIARNSSQQQSWLICVCWDTLSFQEKHVTHRDGNFSKLLTDGIVHVIAVKVSETW